MYYLWTVRFGDNGEIIHTIVATDAKCAIDMALVKLNKISIDMWKLSDISSVRREEKIDAIQGLT